jgi:DNA polymerase-1
VRADYAVCVFDAPGKTFRDEIYPDYKATRSPMPPDLRAQIDAIHEVVRLLGWKVLNVPGVEADDVIGTLACMATEHGLQTIISSGDKDLSQLVNEHVTVIDTMNDRKRDMAGVEAEFGVPPRLMVDYQTLVGDAVDNVPGVDKVGPKTAVKLLQEYGSLDNLVERADEVKGAVGENLRKALDWLPKGRQLLTIRTDCDLKDHIPGLPALEDIVIGGQDVEKLKEFYDRYGFKGLVKQLESHDVPPELIEEQRSKKKVGPGAPARAACSRSRTCPACRRPPTCTTTPSSPGRVRPWLRASRRAAGGAGHRDRFARRDAGRDRRPVVQHRAGPGLLRPAGARLPGAPDQLPRDEVLQRLKPWLENPSKAKLGQHVKYDRHVFANHGIEVRGYVHDTMLQSYVLEVHKPHGLASLAERHLGRSGIDYETIAGKGAHQITVQPGADRQGGRVLVRGLGPDAGRAPGAVAQAGTRRQAALHLRPGDAEQRGAVPHRAQRRADRRRGAGAAEPRAGPAHHAAGTRGARPGRPALQPGQPQADRRECCSSPSWACRW